VASVVAFLFCYHLLLIGVMLIPNTASIIIFDLLSVTLLYLVQTCSVLYAARLHTHQVGELALQGLLSQATLLVLATKRLGGLTATFILFLLALTTLLRYLATLLSWKFSPIVVESQKSLAAVTLPCLHPQLITIPPSAIPCTIARLIIQEPKR
jgi:hypothetical protein